MSMYLCILACRHLALSTNCIEKISSLSGLDNLRILSLGRNLIKKLENLDAVADTLEELWISYNQIGSLVSIHTRHTHIAFFIRRRACQQRLGCRGSWHVQAATGVVQLLAYRGQLARTHGSGHSCQTYRDQLVDMPAAAWPQGGQGGAGCNRCGTGGDVQGPARRHARTRK